MKTWLKILIIVLIILLAYNSIIYQGPFEGKVLDAITKQPIKNLDISYTYSIHRFTGNAVDVSPSYNVKKSIVYTDPEGNYKIPGFLSFKIPILDFGSRIFIIFPVSDMSYQTKFAEEYYFESVKTADASDKYPVDIKTSFFKQKVDVLLIPKLKDSIQQCELISLPYSKIKCISLNSWDIAHGNNDVSLCNNLDEEGYECKREICTHDFYREKLDCKNGVYENLAVEHNDISFCDNLKDGTEYGTKVMRENCIGRVERLN